MAIKRDIKYTNRDFTSLREALINYSKTYFPTTYNDFSPASPGMMFMELSSYVGDVLSFYLDNQVQETYLQYARQNNNLYELAYMFGYKPKVTNVATTTLDFYQKVPAIFDGISYNPDYTYALFIPENSTVQSNINSSIQFLIQDSVDFSVSSPLDPTEVTVYEVAGSTPISFLLKKSRKAISSTINTTTFTFRTPQKFTTVTINDEDIVGILDIVDSDGNVWYEVDYLGQETIYNSIKNTNPNDPNNYLNAGDAPYLLRLEKIQRRFVSRFIDSGSLQLQFGSGVAQDTDEEILPNPEYVGIGLPSELSKLTTAYAPNNFLFTKTYGIAPSNTTLTVRYLTGGGVSSNVNSNELTTFAGTARFLNSTLNSTTATNIRNSLIVSNPVAASGGQDGDTLEEIRQNTLANFSTQLRNVTPDDYLVRAVSMPSKFGAVAKAYVERTKAENKQRNDNLDLYVLTYTNTKTLTTASKTLKQNLSTYLSEYMMVGDSINIKDAFIVNIGVNFDIVVLPGFNNSDILGTCLSEVRSYFETSKWQINQPIVLRDLYILLDRVEGVQTVKNISVTNKSGASNGYSNTIYDTDSATRNNTVYPSLDPMIFEVKYPDTDIQGRVVPL